MRQTQIAENKSGSLQRYFRAVNYLAAAQVYLKSNALLEQPLRADDIKDRLLGHWGTCPGINFIYAHLNRLKAKTNANFLLVTGPGHGAAANLANMYLEGTLAEFYPELSLGREGLERFVKRFRGRAVFRVISIPRCLASSTKAANSVTRLEPHSARRSIIPI